MTQEDKELLLKDLCARLPYGIKCRYQHIQYIENSKIIDINMFGRVNVDGHVKDICDVKPYLFPLSSMTEEQKEELKNEISKQTDILIERMKNDDCGIDCGKYHFHSLLELEWLLKIHFDYR